MKHEVLIGAVIIAVAILIAQVLALLIAPYRFQAAMLGGFWRFNTITGEAVMCMAQTRPFAMACSQPQSTSQPEPRAAARQ